MGMIKSYGSFSRRKPDILMEELVALLSQKASFEFKPLFDILHANLRARKSASGGEEMLRLRAYEKLQNLVSLGKVKKTGKKYKGIISALTAVPAPTPVAPQLGGIALSSAGLKVVTSPKK